MILAVVDKTYCLLFKKVLREVIAKLPTEPSIHRVVLDFEHAIWSALKDVLPMVVISGCSFHWNQAIWQKVSNVMLEENKWE